MARRRALRSTLRRACAADRSSRAIRPDMLLLMNPTTTPTKAFAAASPTAPLAFTRIPRRAPQASDVAIDVLFCGICHSDLHSVRDEWRAFMPTVYPIVPGHEIVGRVRAVGASVTKHKVGDLVAVGCMVDSDRSCPMCKRDHENMCMNGVYTFNGPDKHLGGVTYGGYSEAIVVDEHFVLRVPKNLDPAGAAPLLCAGITTYSPLRQYGVKQGSKLGVVGLGGLGHMAVKLGAAMGAHVVVFTTSPNKMVDAVRLGAAEAVDSRDAAAMAQRAFSLDVVIDTISADHDPNPYLNLLAPEGTMVMVGAPSKPLPVSAFSLIMGNRRLAGSGIGGIAETQEMLDFCGQHGITADVEVISVQQANAAYERLLKGDVKYRFVLDMASLKAMA
jgi:uncharacterized zinc-type alcohol dehydrogenase-like protein